MIKIKYELSYIDENGKNLTIYFYSKIALDNFIFSDNNIIVIYIYNFKTHNYDYVGNFDEIIEIFKLNIGLKILEKLFKKECD